MQLKNMLVTHARTRAHTHTHTHTQRFHPIQPFMFHCPQSSIFVFIYTVCRSECDGYKNLNKHASHPKSQYRIFYYKMTQIIWILLLLMPLNIQ
jgi:hypothetical protein